MSVLKPITGTPWVSRYSSVRPRSRIDLAPAHTTATGVRASSCKSADTSNVRSAPRCTPPMPPVAKTAMPAMAASIMVAATVVAPDWPAATTKGTSRRLTLMALWPNLPSISISAASRPTFNRPFKIAMVAGTAPWARTSTSTRSAVCTFCG